MTRSGKYRPVRIAALIRESIAEALARQVKDPRVGFVTITGVKVSADMAYATVSVSVMGSEEEKVQALEGLGSASGFLRSVIAGTLNLRTVPALRFELDRGLEHAARIDRLINQIKQDQEPF